MLNIWFNWALDTLIMDKALLVFNRRLDQGISEELELSMGPAGGGGASCLAWAWPSGLHSPQSRTLPHPPALPHHRPSAPLPCSNFNKTEVFPSPLTAVAVGYLARGAGGTWAKRTAVSSGWVLSPQVNRSVSAYWKMVAFKCSSD